MIGRPAGHGMMVVCKEAIGPEMSKRSAEAMRRLLGASYQIERDAVKVPGEHVAAPWPVLLSLMLAR
jgi:hypothetical protein